MNLYLKILTRQLMPTSAFEKLLESRIGMVERYRKVEQSAEWKEYQQLNEQISTDAFQSNKVKLLNTRYSDTYEGKTMAKLRRLGIHPDVMVYQSIVSNKNIAAYLEFAKQPENLAKLQDKELVKNDATLRMMRQINKSLIMRDFRRREHGKAVQEYLKLKAETQTEAFRQSNQFWQDPHRWFTTPESQTDARFQELQHNPEIAFYLKQKPEEIVNMEQFEPAFADDFMWSDLSHSDWKPGFHYPNKDFKSVHSYTNEQQAYGNGKHVWTAESILHIDTKKEHTIAPAWDEHKGMVMHEFDYASDVINNADVLSMENGIVQVKARCRGLLNHGIYLRGAKHLPFISVFNFENHRLFCGVKTSKDDKLINKKLNGLLPISYFIYSVAWDKDEIVWYVNNLEVYRTKNTIPQGEKLYLHIFSYGLKDKLMSEGSLEVDWVRVAKLKN